MTEIVLDARARAMTVGELLDRTAEGPVRLIDPDGAERGKLTASSPIPRGFVAGVEANVRRGDRPRPGALTGPELRAKLQSLGAADPSGAAT